MFFILKSTISIQSRPLRDHLNNRSTNTGKLKPFIMSFLLYTESNQEIVLNVQFIFTLPLTAFMKPYM